MSASRRSSSTAIPTRTPGSFIALLLCGEADVLRDEGEAYAAKLREAGVDVTATRYEGIIHDFVMLNDLRDTNAAKSAMAQATAYLSEVLA